MRDSDKRPSEAERTEQARSGLRKAETGDRAGVRQVEEAEAAVPEGAEAAVQEASDGPAGKGLSR